MSAKRARVAAIQDVDGQCRYGVESKKLLSEADWLDIRAEIELRYALIEGIEDLGTYERDKAHSFHDITEAEAEAWFEGTEYYAYWYFLNRKTGFQGCEIQILDADFLSGSNPYQRGVT